MGVRFNGGFGARSQALRRERLIFVGGSTLMCALMMVGAVVLYSHSNSQAREELSGLVRDDNFGNVVLIAPAKQVPRGTKITAGDLQEISWPSDRVPEGAVRSIEDVDGMFSLATLPSGQPIVRTNIAPNPLSFGIQEQLPPGHRAVTIDVDAISGVEGWAQPGAHVDVFLTYVDPKDGQHVTRVAVENAVVLSLGGSARKNNQEDVEKSSVASTVTLAVPFEDSLKIQTAKAMGRITLALRASGDITSPGAGEFRSGQWGQQVNKERDVFVPKGFVRFTNREGGEEQMFLGKDNKWFSSRDGGQ